MKKLPKMAGAGMRKFGENPEQKPFPYISEIAVRGVSRPLGGGTLRRQNSERRAFLKEGPKGMSRKTYDVGDRNRESAAMEVNTERVGRGREIFYGPLFPICGNKRN